MPTIHIEVDGGSAAYKDWKSLRLDFGNGQSVTIFPTDDGGIEMRPHGDSKSLVCYSRPEPADEEERQ